MAINDPRDIPGLLVWYSAEYEAANYTDGQVMTSWTDLSGNGNHATIRTSATPLWFATGGANNGPRIAGFADNSGPGGTGDGGGFMLPAAILTGLTVAEAAISVRPEAAGYGPWNFGADTQTSHFPHGNGSIYDEFGTTARKTVGTGLTLNVWHRYAARTKAGAWTAWLDDAQKFTTTTNTVGWVTGQAPSLGDSGSGLSPLYASLGAFLLYNRELTATERADRDAWLAANPSGGTTGLITPAAALTGTAPAVTGAFDLATTEPPPAITLTGTAPAVTGAFDASVAVPPISADLAGNAPKVTGAFALEQTGVGILDLSGTAPGVFGSFDITASGVPIEVATGAVDRANGMTLRTEWQVEVNPPVTEPKRQRAHDYAVAVSITEPTLVEGRPT